MAEATDQLSPLVRFYARAGKNLPPVTDVPGDAVPQPYRSLLVHQHDMTPTLEEFHRDTITLQVLDRLDDSGTLCRRVLLLLDESGKAVEYGAIVIHARRFPDAARDDILGCRIPLGTVLRVHRIEHSSSPRGYFSIPADDEMAGLLDASAAQRLYGRCNVISDANGQALADIVEILPP